MRHKNYQDLIIQISAAEDGSYSAQVIGPTEHRTTKVSIELPDELRVHHGGVHPRGEVCYERGVRVNSRKHQLDAKQIGKILFDAIFQGPVGKRFQQLRPSSDEQGLRIELALAGSREAVLHALPWELLCENQHLGRNNYYSIVRSVHDSERASPAYKITTSFVLKPRLRVLVIASDPVNFDPLELQVETEDLQRANLKVECLADVSQEGLVAHLRKKRFDILHFMGHGSVTEGIPVLYFKDKSGIARKVSGTELVEDLNGLRRGSWPNLIVLNSCYGSAVPDSQDDLSGVAQELIKAGIPAVVAMRREIPDQAAIRFSRALYAYLAQGKTLDEAVVEGRGAIAMLGEDKGGGSWSVPVLFSRLLGGRLIPNPFPLKLAAAVLFVLTMLIGAGISYEMLRDIRVGFDPVVIPDGQSYASTWENTRPLEMGLAVTPGIRPTQGEGDFQVSISLEKGKQSRLRGTILDSKQRALPEIILQADGATTPEAIEALKQELLFRLLDRFSLLDEAVRGRIERLKPVKALVRQSNRNGIALRENGDLEAAEEEFEAAIRADDDYAVAHANLAMLRYSQADYEGALAPAQRAVGLIDRFQVFHYNLGRIQLALGDTSAAASSFRQALKLDPGYVAARHEQAKLLMASDERVAARRALEKCGRFAPAIKNLGRLEREAGNAELAASYLEDALSLFAPDDHLQRAETRYLLALAYDDQKQLELACQQRLAYSTIPYADRLSWDRELEALACEPMTVKARSARPSPKQPGPFALIVDVNGSFTKVTKSGQSGPVSSRDALIFGTRLKAEKGAEASLLCGSERRVHLKGPGSWLLEEALCQQGEPETAGLFSLLLDSMETEQLSLGPVDTLRSRGGSDYTVLGPIEATSSSEPELIWLDAGSTARWQLTLKDRRRSHSVRPQTVIREQLPLAKETRAICRIAWPKSWPALRPGTEYLLEIKTISDEEPVMMNTSLRLIEGGQGLRERLAQIDELEPLSRQLARTTLLRSVGDRGGTIASQLDLFGLRGSDGDALVLAQDYLSANRAGLAALWFAYLNEREIDVTMRAAVWAGLGEACLMQTEYAAALTWLSQARGLYMNLKKPLAVALIDASMAEARTHLAKLEDH